MAWGKGQSGNPMGRSKSAIALATIARRNCKKAIELCVKVLENEEEKTALRLQAADMLLDRGLGKPAQGVTTVSLTDEELVKELMARKEARDALQRRPRDSNTPEHEPQ